MTEEKAIIYAGNTLQKAGDVSNIWRHEDGIVNILFTDGEEWETHISNVVIKKKKD